MKRILCLLVTLCILFLSNVALVQPINPVIKKPYLASVVIVDKTVNVFGSGVVIRNGLKLQVLTAAHVIEGIMEKKKKIYVLSIEYRKPIPVILFKIDHNDDLALLSLPKNTYTIEKACKKDYFSVAKLEPRIRSYVSVATKMPFLGDTVWMVSSPRGHFNTITRGILSNLILHKRLKHKRHILLFGTTADGYYASSGGGLFNNNQELIGIFHMIWKNGKGGILPGGFYSVSLVHIVKFLK